MCSAPISVSTELGPITGAIGDIPAADGAVSGDAVKTCFTAAAPLTITTRRPLGKNFKVNISPYRLPQRSVIQDCDTVHANVCTNAGHLGPGGYAAVAVVVVLAPVGCSAAGRALASLAMPSA